MSVKRGLFGFLLPDVGLSLVNWKIKVLHRLRDGNALRSYQESNALSNIDQELI